MAEKTNEMTPMVGGGSQTHVQVPMQPMPMQGSAMAHAPMVQVPNNQMPMQGGQYVLAPMQQAHMPGPAPVHAPMMMQPMQTAPIQGSGQVQAPMTMQQVPVQGYVPAQGPMMQTQINLAGGNLFYLLTLFFVFLVTFLFCYIKQTELAIFLISLVPPGLEFLAQSAQLTIEQDMDALEWVIGCVEMENKYMVRNNQGTIVFKAEEQSSCFQRQCCGPTREFSMQLLSMNGVPAITMQRPGCMYAQPWLCACLNGISWIFNFFDSCIQEITVIKHLRIEICELEN